MIIQFATTNLIEHSRTQIRAEPLYGFVSVATPLAGIAFKILKHDTSTEFMSTVKIHEATKQTHLVRRQKPQRDTARAIAARDGAVLRRPAAALQKKPAAAAGTVSSRRSRRLRGKQTVSKPGLSHATDRALEFLASGVHGNRASDASIGPMHP